MKPTKEQLADPSWWNNNAKLKDKYCYRNLKTGECFTTWHFNDGVHGFELLAKRPEPDTEKWKPEEGEWCEARTSGKWRKVKTLNVDLGNDLMGFYVPVTENGLSRLIWSESYRPIKTQREEFIEKALSLDCEPVQGMLSRKDFCGELYDAGCRFDLTEKDSN